MNSNGRLTDVVIKDVYHTDIRTGIRHLADSVIVYADAGMKEIIANVEGVVAADKGYSNSDVEYIVYLDPRYDREWVKAEIEAAIKIHGGTK